MPYYLMEPEDIITMTEFLDSKYEEPIHCIIKTFHSFF